MLGGTQDGFVETWSSFENMPQEAEIIAQDRGSSLHCATEPSRFPFSRVTLGVIYCQNVIIGEGLEKVSGWECLFVHRPHTLVLSIYVDDFEMAGRAAEADKIQTALGKKFDLEPPVPIGESTYLGRGQEAILPPAELIAAELEMFEQLFTRKQTSDDATADEKAELKWLSSRFVPPKPSLENKARAY